MTTTIRFKYSRKTGRIFHKFITGTCREYYLNDYDCFYQNNSKLLIEYLISIGACLIHSDDNYDNGVELWALPTVNVSKF